MLEAYPFDDLGADSSHEALDMFGPQRRQDQGRSRFLRCQQSNTLLKTFLEGGE
jgi:hypothetical protein